MSFQNDPQRTESFPAAQMRVALFSDSFPERNGAGAYYFDLAPELLKHLEALTVFQPTQKKRLLQLALPLPGDPTQKLLTPNIPPIVREFRVLRPHLVIGVTPGPFGLLGLMLARRARCPFITAFHTHFEGLVQLYGNTLFFRFANWYLETINKILCRRSATVLINNSNLTSTVERLGAPGVEVMGTPLSQAFLGAPLQPPPPGLKQVLFAGRLAPEKNLPEVIAAAKAHHDVQVVIVGDGPLRTAIARETAALPNVRLTGWLDRPALRAEMDAANLLLLPSHMETFGTVALESMARGRPALVAASAGIHDWPLLKPALFRLEAGQSVTDALTHLKTLPTTEWQRLAEVARGAAEHLHGETIQQWVDLISRYARRQDR
jgi:glycosyltransferase involved in cell wall biosynthesis